VRGGGGRRKLASLRDVEPARAPPTFAEFLKRRKPTALKDVIGADSVAALLKAFVPADVGWVERSETHHGDGYRAFGAQPILRSTDWPDLEDQLDAVTVLAALPDPAVIDAQRLAAEAQDLADIAAVLARL
jgi:hypothetical protein